MTTTTDKPTSIAFAAPAQQLLMQRYGDPRTLGWEDRWMERWPVAQDFAWFPQAALYLHKDFKPMLQAAFTELTATGLHREIKTCDGCFNIRHVRGGYSVLSVHSWGAALDLNARDNPMGSAGSWSDAFIDAMTRHGIFCGQRWTGRTDPMHFAMVNG